MFQKDVNVIIGPNASGKTTLINILFDSLSGNIPRLCRTDFSKVLIKLKSFEGRQQKTLRLTRGDEDLSIIIGKAKFLFPLEPFIEFDDEFDFSYPPSKFLRRQHLLRRHSLGEVKERLQQLVPAVWLPVSRRLPIAEEEALERRRLHQKPLESVDESLADLIDSLQQYRLGLNAELSELRREFQRHALENILYDKQHDESLLEPRSFVSQSEDDKKALLKAFSDVGLVDKKMEAKINQHFAAANEASKKLKSLDGQIDMRTVFIIPLINRTRTIVGFAQKLENQREELFSALHRFEKIVDSFLNEKTIKVSDKGELKIFPQDKEAIPIEWRHLSSGEKQILILLTQALLSEKTPTVFVVDEPELSLHVDWQEKLLRSLTQLAGRCQFIAATHSPDIVSGYGDKVIDLARL